MHDYGRGAALHRLRNEPVAVGARAHQGHEHLVALDRARGRRDPRHHPFGTPLDIHEGETRQGHQSAHGHRTAPVILATASFAARGTPHRTPPCADIAAISFDCGGTPSVDNMIVNSRPSTADAYGAGSCATTRPLPTMRSGPLQPCSASRTS